MILKNDNISVCIDDKTGITTGITYPNDEFSMNWIIENSDWGMIDGFATEKVCMQENRAKVQCNRDKLQIEIDKEIDQNGYYETY